MSTYTMMSPYPIDHQPWRTGRKLERTIYEGDVLIGLMDTAVLAHEVVDAVNAARAKARPPARHRDKPQ